MRIMIPGPAASKGGPRWGELDSLAYVTSHIWHLERRYIITCYITPGWLVFNLVAGNTEPVQELTAGGRR